jgi:PAS domain S-box-containing protein
MLPNVPAKENPPRSIFSVFPRGFEFHLTPLRGRAAAVWGFSWFLLACALTGLLWAPFVHLVSFLFLFAATAIIAARSGVAWGLGSAVAGVLVLWSFGAIPEDQLLIRGFSVFANSSLVIWLGSRLRKGRVDSLAYQEGISEAVSDFMWSFNPVGKLTYVNQRTLDYHAISLEQILREGWEPLVAKEDLPKMADVMQQALKSGERFEIEGRSRRHDGEERWFHHRCVPIKNIQGKVQRWIGTSTDIHERKLAEMEREKLLAAERQARAQAENASRIKDEFLGTLSHELRTPLTAIVGWVHIFQTEELSPAEFKEGVEVIERNCRAQIRLIEDLLDMSRIITGKIRLEVQLVDLPVVVRAAIEAVKPSADVRGIHLVPVLDAELSPVRGDPARLQQIVWNLLSNAIKFTPREGRVEIRVHRTGSNLEIVVSDTGIGMSAEFLPYIFERFRQADSSTTREYEGLGLGLSIVKQLVELQGGTVQASSDGKGRGSTFRVSFPISAVLMRDHLETVNPSLPSVTGERPHAPELGGIRVLVVDDEEDSRDVVRRILSRNGATVAMASSALDALDELRQTRYHALISDIGMPETDGYELIRKIRALTPEEGSQIPAIALTAFAHVDDRRKAIQAGFDVFISKPVDPAELTVLVERCASRANLARESAA